MRWIISIATLLIVVGINAPLADMSISGMQSVALSAFEPEHQELLRTVTVKLDDECEWDGQANAGLYHYKTNTICYNVTYGGGISTLLHEYAHAYDNLALDDAWRTMYASLCCDMPEWTSGDYSERPSELFARKYSSSLLTGLSKGNI